MAEELPNEASETVKEPDNILLNHQFSIKGVQYDVQITGNGLKWSKCDDKGDGSQNQVLDWKDIISVHASAEATQAKKKSGNTESSPCMVIQHIQKLPKNIWKPNKVIFNTSISQVPEQWVERIKELMEQNVPDRPKCLLVFVNPVSGGKRGRQIYQKHGAPVLEMAKIKTDVIVTERAGHATEVLMTYDLSQVDGIVAVGGDGTITEIINGLLRRQAKDAGKDLNDPNVTFDPVTHKVGIIPAGTGQGLVGLTTGTKDPTTATLHLVVGHSFPYSAFTVHSAGRLVHIGYLLVGYGFFSDGIYYSERHRGSLGRARYIYGLGKALAKWRTLDAEFQILPCDSEEASGTAEKPDSDDTSTTAPAGRIVAKGTFQNFDCYTFDLNMKQAEPMACLWVHLLRPSSRTSFMKRMGKAYKFEEDAFAPSEILECFKAKAVRIIDPDLEIKEDQAGSSQGGDHRNVLNIDGEIFKVTNPVVDIKLIPSVFNVYGTFHTAKDIKG